MSGATARWKAFPFQVGLLQSGRYTVIHATKLSEFGVAVLAPFEKGKRALITLRVPGHPIRFFHSTFESVLSDKSSVLAFDKLALSDKRILRAYVVALTVVRE